MYTVCVRQVGSEAIRRCDAVMLRYGFRVFAVSRRCDAATPLASSRCRDAATLQRLWGSSRLCDSAMLRRRRGAPRVFASLRRCDAAGRLLASLLYRDAATLRHCDADGVPLRDAATLHAVVSPRLRVFRLKLRAVARFFAVSRRCVDASDAATLQPWGGWWLGLHAVVTSMYWLKQWP